jgi:ABC-type transport system substrate-binding protein
VKRQLAFLLAAPVAVWAALGPRYGGDLTIGLLEIPAWIEPRVPLGTSEQVVAGLVHETLVAIGPDGLPTPALAQGWAASEDGREWTLRLREGAVFHDDKPVTAEDALRSLRRFLRSPSPAAAGLAGALEGGSAFRSRSSEELPGLAAPEPLRLVLRFSAARLLSLAPLAARAAAIVGAGGAACGPFVPTVRTPGRIGLTPFGGHVRGRPYLDRVQIVAVADRAAATTELQAGRIDVAPGEAGVAALAATLLLVLDPARPLFAASEARAAVAAAVDRADLVSHFLAGGDASASLLVPGLLPPLGLEAPARHARLTGSVVMAVGKDVPPLVSQRVVAYLAEAGLAVTVAAATPSAARKASAPLRLLLWTPEVAEPELALAELALLAPDAAGVREELAAAGQERDLDRRRTHLHRAEAALRASNVLVPIASAPVAFGVRRGLHGVSLDLAGRLVLEDAWVEP